MDRCALNRPPKSFSCHCPTASYALNQTQPAAFAISGSSSTSVISPDCGIAVDSSDPAALDISGGAQIKTGFIKIVGGYKNDGHSQLSPTPTTGVGQITDPLASLAAPPTPTQCDYTNFSVSQGNWNLRAGTFCGGINISGQANVDFGKGIYYIYGGGISINGTNVVVTGSEVVFFNTDGHGISRLPTSNYAPLNIQGQPNITLSAPDDGTYKGILFYKDRLVSASNNTDTINGNTQPALTGTLYLPGDNLMITGQGGLGVATGTNNPAIIADTITIHGGGTVIQTGNGSLTQFKVATLVQ